MIIPIILVAMFICILYELFIWIYSEKWLSLRLFACNTHPFGCVLHAYNRSYSQMVCTSRVQHTVWYMVFYQIMSQMWQKEEREVCGKIYDFCMEEETWRHVSVHWQQGKCQLWSNFIKWKFKKHRHGIILQCWCGLYKSKGYLLISLSVMNTTAYSGDYDSIIHRKADLRHLQYIALCVMLLSSYALTYTPTV